MNAPRVGALASCLIVTATALTGCATASPSPPSGTEISVTVAAYPLQFLAERIIGEAGTVTNLTPPGTEPHDLELSARQIAELASTDAVIYLAGFQAAVDAAIQTAPPKLTVDATTGLTGLAGSEPAEPGEAGHDQEGRDPHVWLSPPNMVTMTQTISAALSAAKPELAENFGANATKLTRELDALDADFASGLANCQVSQFITSHAAFGYLANEYGLTQIGIAGLDPSEEPTAARIAEVQRLAKEYHVTTVFFEVLASDAVAKSIAGDLGLKTAVLDPIEGITKDSAGSNYAEVMQSNLSALRAANQCS